MIRYSLVCDSGHEFDGWFGNSDAFEAQSRDGDVVCPHCGSARVSKALMAPNVATSKAADDTEAPSPELREAVRKVREHVEKTADYVGDSFAEEARKIHYEEVEPRGIYGEATPSEAVELSEEGVEFHPLPAIPEDQN
ncbi:MAG: DUF1178 family protein [Methyloligellaceae bacterium]